MIGDPTPTSAAITNSNRTILVSTPIQRANPAHTPSIFLFSLSSVSLFISNPSNNGGVYAAVCAVVITAGVMPKLIVINAHNNEAHKAVNWLRRDNAMLFS